MRAAWKDTTDGIHAFLTFDSKVDPSLAAAYADRIDYVWGSTESRIAWWRASKHPSVVLSKYIPFTRDPAPNASIGKDEHLAWWQANHPELVLYTCDQKTPAWECFSGEGCSHVNVPLDLTQPGTLAYQLRYGVDPAKSAGYSAIAFDNFGLRNQWKACGSFSGPNGAWKQIYDAADPEHDAQYALDVIDWFRRATAAIHDRGQLRYVRNLQRAGKGYFAINEWGAGPDYGLNPSKFPFNVSGDANRPVRQFVTAAFMMSNGGASGIFLSCIQCYGGNAGGLGNLSIWPEAPT